MKVLHRSVVRLYKSTHLCYYLWCPVKGQTYLNKPVALRKWLVCVGMTFLRRQTLNS